MLNIYNLDDNYLFDESEEKKESLDVSIDENISNEEETPLEAAIEEDSPLKVPKEEDSVEATTEETHSAEVLKEEASVEVATEKSSKEETPAEPASEEATKNEAPLEKVFLPFLIGKKVGMTQLFSQDGIVYPATVVEAGPCVVTQIKKSDSDGYNAVQLGFLNNKSNKVNRPLKGHYKKSNTTPKKYLKEFRLNKISKDINLGDKISVAQFNIGDLVNVTGYSKGKGFAGHMKRHGFSGGRASHGKNSVMRKAGSVGAGTDPGRIFPGMKMAGRMGNDKVNVKNLNVINIDFDKNLIFIKGAIPGPNNNIVYLSKVI